MAKEVACSVCSFRVRAVWVVRVVEVDHVVVVGLLFDVEVPRSSVALFSGGPVPEGNEKLVAFPLGGLVGLEFYLPSLDVEFKVSEPVELLPRSLARG